MPAVFRRCLRAAFSPAGALVAAAFGLLIFLGCLSIGGTSESHAPPDDDRVVCQEGQLSLVGYEERDVYYPQPCASPPYLVLKGLDHDNFKLLDQQPTHFRVRNVSQFAAKLHWEAKGVRGHVAPIIAPEPPAPPQPLPTEPVPVEAAPTGKAR